MTLVLSLLCLFLFVFHGVGGKEMVVKEDEAVTLECDIYQVTVFWVRLKEKGFEYIGTYSKTKKGKAVDDNKFEVNEKSLVVKRFGKQQDSGTYSCASINNNELRFSGSTTLRGETVPTTIKPKQQTTRLQTVTSMTNPAVTCRTNSKVSSTGKNTAKIDALLGCELQIFIPLVAGCGLLLLLLIITILYCNSIRTRRCPHHYKRKPRSRPAGHKSLPNPLDY